MTSILSAKHSTARRPATSGDAPALPGQDVTPTARSAGRVNGGKSVLLVILHYLLKNNITFMCGMKQGKIPPEARRVHGMIKSRRVSLREVGEDW